MESDALWTRSEQLEAALLAMDPVATRELLDSTKGDDGLSPIELADGVILPTLTRFGDAWDHGRLTLSQVYMAARILEQVLGESFKPVHGLRSRPVIGVAVLEDYHALGKRIVHAVLTSAGCNAIDLGTGLSVDEIVERVEAEDIEILMISVLMFNKALHVTQLVERLKAQGLGHVRVVVGGAPFIHDPELWRQVGADACGRSAADAIRLAIGTTRGGQP
jgi:methanogenic corrinoid protein MtbC1